MTLKHSCRKPAGTTLVEVLVTVVIIAIGLLGLANLQSRLQLAQVEAYQRSQALILLKDMASRIETNRGDAASYETGAGNPVGVGMTCPTTTGTSTRQQIDHTQWCLALQGAAELQGTNKAGAMIGGRGCVEQVLPEEYMITVAWQGQGPISAPPAGVACGQNLYDAAGTPCTNDRCRRVVTTLVRIATLT